MPTGIDVDESRIVVATPEGLTTHHNGVLRVERAPEDALSARTEHATYLIGDDAAAAAESTAGLDPLLGGESNLSEDARRATTRAFVSAVAEDGKIRYVARPDFGVDPLGDVLHVSDRDASELDAGMAVCYDVFDAPVTGLGVAIFEGSVTATVVTGGLSVASATVDASDDWYNYGRLVDGKTSEKDRLGAAWATMQYETLFSDLADELADDLPSIEGPLPVAVGGDAAPSGIEERLAAALDDELPVEVGDVSVADDPGESPARGALVAAESAGDGPTTTPAYAEDVPHGGGPTDPDGTVGAMSGGVARASATAGTVAGPGLTEATTAAAEDGTAPDDLEASLSGAYDDLSKLERRSAKTARALSELIGELGDIAAGAEGLSEVREDLDELEERVEAETGEIEATLETLESDVGTPEGERPLAESVADLESSLSALQEAVDELDDDTTDIRASLSEMGAGIEADFSGPMEEIAELNDDLDALESRLEEQMDHVWDELGEITDELVDVSAAVEEIPELDEQLSGTRDVVVGLEDQVEATRESIADVREEVSAVREDVPSISRVDSIASELDDLAETVDRVRREVQDSEEVDPERIDELETTIDGLRKTMISQGERIDALENDKEQLDDRIDTVYQNSAKAEALSSLETEVSRIRQTANEANEGFKEIESTVEGMESTVGDHSDEIAKISRNVDNLAGSAVTRSEVNADLDDLEGRLGALEAFEADVDTELDELWDYYQELAAGDMEEEDDGLEYAIILQSVGLVFVGILGAALAATGQSVLLAAGFVVLVVLPGVFAWLLS